MYLTDCFVRGPGSFPMQSLRSILRDFSLADHALPAHLEPAWQQMARSPFNATIHPVDIEELGKLKPNREQTMAEIKNKTDK